MCDKSNFLATFEPRFAVRMFNGLPAILVEDPRPTVKAPTRYTIHFEVNDEGRIRGLQAVRAPSKLSAIT